MVNPLLTLLFDLFLIGSALLILAGMAHESLSRREPAVGRAVHKPSSRTVRPLGRGDAGRTLSASRGRRRGAVLAR
jgi:hypothetical protein